MTSSRRRNKRVRQFATPKNVNDLLIIASDNEDKEYPIFREPCKTDQMKTVATGKLSAIFLPFF